MTEGDVWWVSIHGQQEGPMSEAEVVRRMRAGTVGADAHVYREGIDGWQPIGSRDEFKEALGGARPAQPPPPPPAAQAAHEIDYEIFGEELQFVEITLDPGEACIAEAGAFFYMDPGIQMQTIFGDGSAKTEQGGMMGKLLAAGKRVVTGESLFMTVFGNQGQGRQKVSFAAPYPGGIVPVDLRQHGGALVCQRDAFLCAAKGISVGVALNKRLGAGFFGGEGFILQKLEGDGLAFVHAGGAIVSRQLGQGETLRVDTGCLVAFEQQVGYDIQLVSGVKTALFGGEGLFFATLTGPGRVWLQSLPFSRVAERVLAAGRALGRQKKGEGSPLGGLGGLLMGD